MHVSVLTKLGPISLILFSLTYSYHCYCIRLAFWLLSRFSTFAIYSPDAHRFTCQWPEEGPFTDRVVRLHSIQQIPKMEVTMTFSSTLKVLLYAKEEWQERDLWQQQQVNSSNSINERSYPRSAISIGTEEWSSESLNSFRAIHWEWFRISFSNASCMHFWALILGHFRPKQYTETAFA